VRYILIIFSVFLFSLTVISCKSSDDDITSSTSSTGLFVTVGDNGIILTSSDGISWTKRTSVTTNNLYGVTYGNSTFVTVGDNGTILTSSDNGTSWTNKRTSSVTTNNLYGVTYANSTFVTVGDNATILTSSDGTTWTNTSTNKRTLRYFSKAETNNLYGVTYGDGLFVTVGDNGVILTSSDGISWTKRTSGDQPTTTTIVSVSDSGGDMQIESTNHSLDVGDVIRFTTTGTLPTGLALSTDYYVVAVPINNSFYVSETESGTPIVYTDAGTGKHSWQSSIALYEGTEQDDEEDTERRARASFPVPSVTIDTLHAVTYSNQL